MRGSAIALIRFRCEPVCIGRLQIKPRALDLRIHRAQGVLRDFRSLRGDQPVAGKRRTVAEEGLDIEFFISGELSLQVQSLRKE